MYNVFFNPGRSSQRGNQVVGTYGRIARLALPLPRIYHKWPLSGFAVHYLMIPNTRYNGTMNVEPWQDDLMRPPSRVHI